VGAELRLDGGQFGRLVGRGPLPEPDGETDHTESGADGGGVEDVGVVFGPVTADLRQGD
jgi:hypothetical protein